MAGTTGTTTIPVSITSSANPADAGLPFELTAQLPSPSGWYYLNWTDSQGGSNTSPTWGLDIADSGTLTVTLRVSDPWGDRGIANLTVTIRPRLSLTLSSPLSQVDSGVPAPFFINVEGGVPPITATWIPSSGGANGSAGWSADGNYSEAVAFETAGPAWLLVRAADALGDPASIANLVAEVVPSGVVELTTNSPVGEVGWPLGLVVVVEEGAPPFRWSFASTLPAVDPGGPFGVFPSDGIFPWSIQFGSSGTCLLNLTVVDALGALEAASVVVAVAAALSVNITSSARAPASPFGLAATVSGGVAPYDYQLRLSDGEGIAGTLTGPGSLVGTFNPRVGGNYSVDVRVTDRLGQTWDSTRFLHLDGGPTAASGSSPNGYAMVGALSALLVVALFSVSYLYRRFRARSAPADSPSRPALPTVRQLMKRSQTIDRETLLLLGEEAGESADDVQAALQTLIRTGEVTTEPGPTDDVILHWKGVDTPTDPREASR